MEDQVVQKPDFSKAEEKASAVLDENFVIDPPVNVKELVKNYGLDVKEIDFGEEYKGVSGFIDPEKRIIYVDKNDRESRKSFTVAHELGHWILHKDKLEQEPNKYAILYRIPLGRANIDPVESEANRFAASLLVPRKLLEENKGKSLDELAEIFRVSRDVIGFRMKDLYGHSAAS